MSSISGNSTANTIGSVQMQTGNNVASSGSGQVWGRNVTVASGTSPMLAKSTLPKGISDGGTSLADRTVAQHSTPSTPPFSPSRLAR